MKKVAMVLGAVVLVLVFLRVWSFRHAEHESSPSRASHDRRDAASTPESATPGDRAALPIRPTETQATIPEQRERPAPATTESAARVSTGGSATPGKSAPNLTPETRMHFVRSILQDYRSVYGENPIGSNAEITAALMGKNAKRSQFLRSDDRNLNERGELVDDWGSPYFLHQISGKIMEIRSAGPDKTMWTADDLMVK